jgi:5-methylcytosine-specific restriction endonuclease McrA
MSKQHVKWYDTARWQRRRKLQMTLEPLCRSCARRGLVTPAEVADHITPHKGNEMEFWYSPLQSMCLKCHLSEKAQQEQKGFYNEIGIDGYPVDPNHPFYRNG